jgi:hypothetical protein
MRKRHIWTSGVWTVGMLAIGFSGAWAQDSSAPITGTPQEPVPAYGQENAPPPITENPPLSGIDLPNLEPHAAPLSYLQPGATVSESVDTNAGNSLGGQSASSISRALGSLTLQRLWSHYDLALDYMGGVGYYDLQGQGLKALQQMDFDQKVTWKRGEASLRDTFSYLPEGNFGGAYGSLGSQGIASLGTTAFSSFWGGGALGALGLVPRILNLSMADLSEYLSPKSAITAAGGYAISHFYGSDVVTDTTFVGSSQFSGQVGYNRILTPHTQVALMYGYQAFDFSALGTAFHSHVVQLMYGRQISGRMDFLIAAGPQLTHVSVCPIFSSGICLSGYLPDTRLGVAGRARLRYRFPKTSVSMMYERFDTSGSGLFAGAQTDVATLSADRPLSRVWSATFDLGYARNVRIQPASAGVNANSYQYGFVGGVVHRSFGHNFHGFISYQINTLDFDNSLCAGASACNRISNRQVATFGLDWIPRPIRLD